MCKQKIIKHRSRRIKPENNPLLSPLLDHLEELRKALLRCFCFLIIFAVPCGIFWRQIFDIIVIWPLRLSDPVPQIIFTAPADAVFFIIKIALTCGFILASPLIFYQIWRFVVPGLYKKEKTVILAIVITSTICFLMGVVFCYFLLPLFLSFLIGFAGGLIEPIFRINEYFGFLVRMCLVFGLTFQMPVASFILAKMKILNHILLVRYFRHAIVIIFVLAAILTPAPDALSQILLALPLIALYGLSIFVVFLSFR